MAPAYAPADRTRVFERFVRLDDARVRTDAAGSGLGLAIVAELVKALGGDVTMSAATIGGTRVQVTLPALRYPQATPPGPADATGGGPHHPRSVDDDSGLGGRQHADRP